MMRRPVLSLHTRISLVLTGLAASLLLALAALWLHGARGGIHEEVEAATRVSVQWLQALTGELRSVPEAEQPTRLLAVLRPLGRIRANELEVQAADGRLLYRSPPPTYKAGRSVPEWFAALLAPQFEDRLLRFGELQLVLHPDASRSLVDAWDDLRAMAGWALAALALLFLATEQALDRALRPLGLVMQALDRTGRGRFDTRLPVFPAPELGRLSRAFNGMADRLAAAVDENVRLETEREVAEHMQARLEAERQQIARELHDELAQGITAVRALAGAIVQRSAEQPALHVPAQGIVAVTGEMQDGVRRILQHLQPVAGSGLAAGLQKLLAAWRLQHDTVELDSTLELGASPLPDATAQVVLRMAQEGLTNVARHAAASRVELIIRRHADSLDFRLTDNGVGPVPAELPAARHPGCGFGLRAMAERVAALGGEMAVGLPAGGGFCLNIRLPLAANREREEIA
ncbi:MAG: HAMP domain-containing protein [Rhodocyclales bacterium GT-UBC]|nr:MAG: HAMP domain-containing protein [Rhodocyclales bacterium GT-UBC]